MALGGSRVNTHLGRELSLIEDFAICHGIDLHGIAAPG
jgi:hypothetical protein